MKYSPKTKIKIYPLKLKFNPINRLLLKSTLIFNTKREINNITKIYHPRQPIQEYKNKGDNQNDITNTQDT